MTPEEIKDKAQSFVEVSVIQAGKRCGVQWTPWMGDWFTSWSPRNDNNNAEGPWDHWVDLAIRILQDPMTAIVRPGAHEVAKGLEHRDFYSEADRYLTSDYMADGEPCGWAGSELAERFKDVDE